MDRLLSTNLWAQEFIQHQLGVWTQVEGDSTFLVYRSGVKNPDLIKPQDKIFTEGSYLSNDEGFMTGKLFEQCWVRLGPKAKIAFEFDPQTKFLYLKVFTGSVKVLFDKQWANGKAEKLILQAADHQIEVEAGKFIFDRKPFFHENSIYVEKGLVGITDEAQGQISFIHQNEKISFNDKTNIRSEITKMSEKELKEFASNSYIKNAKR